MSKEWFRRTRWSAADEEDFNRRLARSRAQRRAQYLRIQALHLTEAAPPRFDVALALLDRLITEYPDNLQLAQAHLQRAECLVILGRIEEGIAAFRSALATEREFPHSRTAAYLCFAYFVATSNMERLHDEALDVLEEFGHEEMFPREIFLHNAALALIAHATGESSVAREAAARALTAASQSQSGFRYHPTVGLVEQADPTVTARLNKLAAG